MQVLAISGSTRPASSNGLLLAIAAQVDPGRFQVVASVPIASVPHFDPGAGDDPGPAVVELRRSVAAADGVLIASPEYAHSLPGSLRNALDWLVGSGELYGTPVAVLAATPRFGGGELGRAALVQTLRAQGAHVRHSASVVVPSSGSTGDEVTAAVASALASLEKS